MPSWCLFIPSPHCWSQAGCSHTKGCRCRQARLRTRRKNVCKAAKELDAGNNTEAAKEFDAVDRHYPYSQWATRAQLMAGYAQYKNLKYDDALLALDRFIELHPGDDNIAYAYYLKALVFLRANFRRRPRPENDRRGARQR